MEGYTELPLTIPPGEREFDIISNYSATPGFYEEKFQIISNDVDERIYDISLKITISDLFELSMNGFVYSTDELTPPVNKVIDLGEIPNNGDSTFYTFQLENISNIDLTGLTQGTQGIPLAYINQPLETLDINTSNTFIVEVDTSFARLINGEIFISNSSPYEFVDYLVIGIVVNASDVDFSVEYNNQPFASQSMVQFDEVDVEGVSEIEVFTVLNNGTGDLKISNFKLPEGFLIVDELDSTIPGNSSDTFSIRLDTSQLGIYNSSLTFNTNDIDLNKYFINLTGAVGAAADPEINVKVAKPFPVFSKINDDEEVLNFENQTFDNVKYLQIENQGIQNLIISDILVSNSFTITDENDQSIFDILPIELQPNQDLIIKINRINFNDPVGVYYDSFQIISNDANETPFDITLRTLIGGFISVADDTIEIDEENGEINVGTHSWRSSNPQDELTISNTTDLPISGIKFSSSDPSIKLANTFFRIEPNQSKILDVILSTEFLGNIEGQISIEYAISNSNPFKQSYNIKGNVTALNPMINVTHMGEEISTFPVITITEQDTTKQFEVSNSGEGDLFIDQVRLPYGFELSEGISSVLASGSSDDFGIGVIPTALLGLETEYNLFLSGLVGIKSNDPDNELVEFQIVRELDSGEEPEIQLTNSGMEDLEDNSTLVLENNSATVTLTNEGLSPLIINGFIIPEGIDLLVDSEDAFSLKYPLFVLPNEQLELTLQINSKSEKQLSSTPFEIITNDRDEIAFHLLIQGGEIETISNTWHVE